MWGHHFWEEEKKVLQNWFWEWMKEYTKLCMWHIITSIKSNACSQHHMDTNALTLWNCRKLTSQYSPHTHNKRKTRGGDMSMHSSYRPTLYCMDSLKIHFFWASDTLWYWDCSCPLNIFFFTEFFHSMDFGGSASLSSSFKSLCS